MRASSWRKHVPLEERVGQLNNGTQDINNVENIEGALHRGANSMEMETNKEEMSGAKLFERDPKLFDRRFGGRRNRLSGSCDCGAKYPSKKRRKKRKH